MGKMQRMTWNNKIYQEPLIQQYKNLEHKVFRKMDMNELFG